MVLQPSSAGNDATLTCTEPFVRVSTAMLAPAATDAAPGAQDHPPPPGHHRPRQRFGTALPNGPGNGRQRPARREWETAWHAGPRTRRNTAVAPKSLVSHASSARVSNSRDTCKALWGVISCLAVPNKLIGGCLRTCQ